MESDAQSWTLRELADLLGGAVEGQTDLRILRLGSVDSDDSEALAFVESEAFLARAESRGIGALLLPPGFATAKPCVRVDNPRVAFAKLLALLDRPVQIHTGVHPTAVVDPGAWVHGEACVGAFAVVERGARIDAGARVYAFAYIGERCSVGAGAALYPHAVLRRDVDVAARAVVHSGAVLGGDGFRYTWDGARRMKVPHVGGVRLGADSEIGSNATVDRGTAGDTVVGVGTKIDNLVQIAHNAQLGDHAVIAAQTGLSGSTRVGDRVVMAGQCGVADHVTVASDTIFAGGTGVTGDVREPGAYMGLPARPIAEGRRILAALKRLPDLIARVRRLEKDEGEEPTL